MIQTVVTNVWNKHWQYIGHYSEEVQDEREKSASAVALRRCGRDLLRMFYSVDQQDASTESTKAFQWLLHRYCNSSIINLVDIDLHTIHNPFSADSLTPTLH